MIISILSIIGIFVFAMSGVLKGMDNKLDFFGIMTIGFLTASGGGITRDIMLGEVPSIFSSNIEILVIILAAILGPHIHGLFKYQRLFLYFDAMGLALFVTSGTILSYNFGLPVFGILVLGTLSGIGGGIIRDVLLNEVPLVFQGELYASIAILGILLFLVLIDFFSEDIALLVQASFIFIFRLFIIEKKILA